MRCHCVPVLLTILTVVPCRSAAGQVVLDRTSEHIIWIEWEKPSFPESTPFGNGVLFAVYRGRLTPKTFLVVDLPVSNADLVSGGSAKQTGVGNPYLGLEYGRAGAETYWEGGIRLPLASRDDFLALFVGLETDFDRVEAFIPDLFSITTRFNYHSVSPSGGMFHLRPGLAFWIPTTGGEPEMLFDYVLIGGYEKGRVTAGAQLSGRLLVTSGGGNLADRTVNQLGFFGRLRFGSVIPGLELRVPLGDDLASDYILVLRVGVGL